MEKLRLGLEWFLNPDHIPLLAGLEEGWFAAEGLDLEMIEPEEHFDALDEIEAGRMDVAVTEPLHLVADRAEGQPVVGFARFLHTNGGVMFLEGRGIERPRDMAGKRLQYPGAPGPGGPAIVRTMIEADGGPPGAELEPVNNGFYHTDALAEGKADLATLVFYNFELVEAAGRGLDAGFFALKDWGVPDFCQLVLITTESVLRERRGALEALLRVLSRGIDLVHQRPGRAREIYRARGPEGSGEPLARAICDATLPCFTYDLAMSRDYYRRLGQWLAETGQISGVPAPETLWTNELVGLGRGGRG